MSDVGDHKKRAKYRLILYLLYIVYLYDYRLILFHIGC